MPAEESWRLIVDLSSHDAEHLDANLTYPRRCRSLGVPRVIARYPCRKEDDGGINGNGNDAGADDSRDCVWRCEHDYQADDC